MGVNVHDQRGCADNQITHSYPYSQPPPANQTLPNIQPMQPNFWPASANQIPV